VKTILLGVGGFEVHMWSLFAILCVFSSSWWSCLEQLNIS